MFPKAEGTYMATMMNTFFLLVENPDMYFAYHRDSILPESRDLKLISAALYLLGDCYLRGKGLKIHPSSKTDGLARESLFEMYEAIVSAVNQRPYLYPALAGIIGRGQAAMEIEWLLDGYSRWSESESG